MTYINEKFQFTESEIHEYLDKSKKYSGIDFVVSDFVSDLFDGVCVVQREGVEISFTHRSFQEYFTAYFVSRNTEVDLDLFFEKIADRWNDSVILMLFDMNQGFVERNWGANALAEIGSAVKGILPSVDAIGYCKALNIEILITSVDGAIRLIISDSDSRVTRLRRILSRIYSDELRPAKGELASLQRKDHQAFLNGFNKDKIRFNSSFKLKVHKKKVAKIHSDLDYVEIGNVHARLGSEDATWLETSGLAVFLQREYDGFMKLESKVQKRVSRKDDLILDIMSRT